MHVEQAVAVTHAGRKMSRNEDGVMQVPEVPLYAVVDGTGGTEAADVALDVLRENKRALFDQIQLVADDPRTSTRLAVGQLFERVFDAASASIRDAARRLQRPKLAAAMVAATVVDRFAYIAHVGDARAYLLRDGDLWALTTDHTVAMAQLVGGHITEDEYRTSPFQKTLTQALGPTAKLDVEFAEVWLAPGDVLLLCSDGLHRMVSDAVICDTLHEHGVRDASRELIHQALRAGGADNISLIGLEIAGSTGPSSTKSVAETLRGVFLFQDLTEADRVSVAPYLEEVTFDPGEAIVTEGAKGDSFFILVSGEVRVTRGRTFLTDIGPGGEFGELALVGQGEHRRSATVTALTRARLFELSRARFHEILRAKPAMAARLLLPLLDRVGSRLTDLTERLAQRDMAG